MKRKIRYSVISAIAVVLVLVTWGFTGEKHDARLCKDIIVKITNQDDQFFINEGDVLKLLHTDGDVIKGVAFNELDLKKLELRLLTNNFIKEAQVYKDLAGNLLVKVEQNEALARLTRADKADAYLSRVGVVFPLSNRYTSRVLLLSGAGIDKLMEVDWSKDPQGIKMMELLQFIESDPFWKAQIAQIDMNKKGDLVFYTQVSSQLVVFGKAEDIEDKFERLKIFYTRILPNKGWNEYSQVNVKYMDQIICE